MSTSRLFRFRHFRFLRAISVYPDRPTRRYASSLVLLLNSRLKHSTESFGRCIGQVCRCSNLSDSTAHPREELLRKHPNDFAEFLKAKGISRCYFYRDKTTGEVVASHPELQGFSEWFAKDSSSGYHQHEAIFMQLGLRTGCLMAVFLSETNRGQAYGSTRLRDYKTMEIFLREGLKWSQMMGYKTALAGLWIGGGSSIISEPFESKHCLPDFRQKMFFDYGDFISGLNGCFIAGEGMGLHVYDINNIHSRTRFVNCVSDDIGGSGNPAIVTAKGVIMAMEAALDHHHLGPIERKQVAVQGAGNIGYVVISELMARNAEEIIVTDCNQKRLDDVYDTLSSKGNGKLTLEKVQPGDESLLEHDCDILAPCASSYILSQRTIPNVSAKVICGAANNQLMSPVDDCKLLEYQGSAYVVDFIANRMAIVNSANEGYGRLPFDPAVGKHLNETDENSIFNHIKYVLENSEKENISAVEAAYKLAEERTKEFHPIWPDRCQQIIQSLIKRNWHQGYDFWRKRRNFPGFGGDA